MFYPPLRIAVVVNSTESVVRLMTKLESINGISSFGTSASWIANRGIRTTGVTRRNLALLT